MYTDRIKSWAALETGIRLIEPFSSRLNCSTCRWFVESKIPEDEFIPTPPFIGAYKYEKFWSLKIYLYALLCLISWISVLILMNQQDQMEHWRILRKNSRHYPDGR